MSDGASTMRMLTVTKNHEGHGPTSQVMLGGNALTLSRLKKLMAPTNEELRRHSQEGWGMHSIPTFRMVCAELLDYREGRLPPEQYGGMTDADYLDALERSLHP